ncbi:MAG: hypothetical protein IKJ87_04640 [Ruminococcus sp.]|nr:hypothetical protein [Ruminococcus sp.]
MEILIGIVVIVVLLKILGVSNFALILLGLIFLELLLVFMLLFFVFCCFHLLFSKTKQAKFTKFGIPPKGRFTVAYYDIDGAEYPCIFPKESGYTSKSYKTDKIYKVRYSKFLKKVFDVWSICTCILGLLFSVIAVIVTLNIFNYLKYIL